MGNIQKRKTLQKNAEKWIAKTQNCLKTRLFLEATFFCFPKTHAFSEEVPERHSNGFDTLDQEKHSLSELRS